VRPANLAPPSVCPGCPWVKWSWLARDEIGLELKTSAEMASKRAFGEKLHGVDAGQRVSQHHDRSRGCG
jgi:hypothetical protein